MGNGCKARRLQRWVFRTGLLKESDDLGCEFVGLSGTALARDQTRDASRLERGLCLIKGRPGKAETHCGIADRVTPEASPRGDLHERIGISRICTTGQNRLQTAFSVAKIDTILLPVLAVLDNLAMTDDRNAALCSLAIRAPTVE